MQAFNGNLSVASLCDAFFADMQREDEPVREYTGDDEPCLAMSEVGGLASSGHESPAALLNDALVLHWKDSLSMSKSKHQID
jgi:hypothetical protein